MSETALNEGDWRLRNLRDEWTAKAKGARREAAVLITRAEIYEEAADGLSLHIERTSNAAATP